MAIFTRDNLEHKTERPWPNSRLKTAAIVGHTTVTSCRLWMRAGREGTFTLFCFPWDSSNDTLAAALAEVPFDSARLPSGTVQKDVTVSWKSDTTAVLDLKGLKPETEYQYLVADMASGAPQVILGHDRTHRFRTLPVKEDSFSFAFYSCHMPYKDSRFGTPEINDIEMWEYLDAMLERHREQGLRFIIAGGDQVYTDGVKSLSIWRLLDKCMRREGGEIFPDEAAMRGWYRDIYRGYWGFPQVRKVLSNYPVYMIWDDHEIMDGWGSRYFNRDGRDEMERVLKKYNEPEKKLNRDDCDVLMQRMRNAAQAVYEEYQHSHNPKTAPGCYDYGFHHDRSAFYVLDTRGQRDINRTSYRILGKPQFQRFKKWVDGLDVKKTSCLFVTSAVPVLHMDPMWINQDDTFPARLAEVEDDLRDAWEHEAHRDERRDLMKVLFDAAERGIRVCVLSGDVHIAAAFRIENKKGAVVHQLTSSALTYNKPRALGWLLGASVPDDGITSDGYAFKRLALYRESNFALIRVNQKSGEIIFQIYGRQEAQHPSGDVRIPMTHSVAKLVL